jgi:polysaccharide pyruvyl transferase WcaK-like protein
MIFVHGYYGHGNLGDELALKVLAESWGKEGVECTSVNPDHTRRFHGLSSTDVSSGWRGRIQSARALGRASNFVFGGGTFIHDYERRFLKPGIWTPMLCRIAKAWHKPVNFVSVGVGPLRTPYSRLVARLSLGAADRILVRDPTSLEEICGLGGTVAPELGCDLAFLSDIKRQEPGPHMPRYVGLNLVGYRGGRWVDQLGTAEMEAVRMVCDAIIAEDFDILYIPFQQRGIDDSRLGRALRSRLANPARMCIADVTLDNIEEIFSSLRFFVGARLHSIVVARLLNVPFLAIPYHSKVVRFLSDIGMADRAWSPTVDSVSSTLERFRREREQALADFRYSSVMQARLERTKRLLRSLGAAH